MGGHEEFFHIQFRGHCLGDTIDPRLCSLRAQSSQSDWTNRRMFDGMRTGQVARRLARNKTVCRLLTLPQGTRTLGHDHEYASCFGAMLFKA